MYREYSLILAQFLQPYCWALTIPATTESSMQVSYSNFEGSSAASSAHCYAELTWGPTECTSELLEVHLCCRQSHVHRAQENSNTQLTWAWPWDSLPPSKLCCLWDTLSFLLHNLNFSSTRHVLIVPVIWIHSYQVLSKVFLPDSRDGAVLSYCKLRWQFLS